MVRRHDRRCGDCRRRCRLEVAARLFKQKETEVFGTHVVRTRAHCRADHGAQEIVRKLRFAGMIDGGR